MVSRRSYMYDGKPHIPRDSLYIFRQGPGPWFNIKMSSHYGDKTILRPSYLHNGISYTGKTTSLYWIRALVSPSIMSPSSINQPQHRSRVPVVSMASGSHVAPTTTTTREPIVLSQKNVHVKRSLPLLGSDWLAALHVGYVTYMDGMSLNEIRSVSENIIFITIIIIIIIIGHILWQFRDWLW